MDKKQQINIKNSKKETTNSKKVDENGRKQKGN